MCISHILSCILLYIFPRKVGALPAPLGQSAHSGGTKPAIHMMVTLRVNDWLVLALYTGMNYKKSLDVKFQAVIYNYI